MPHVSTTPDARWFVIRTHHHQEVRVEQNLRLGRIETFLPRIPPPRSARAHGDGHVTPLFPQYVFARFNPATSLHDVTFTRGVYHVLRFGDTLASVDDEVIQFFRSRMDAHGFIRIGEPLQPGELVAIQSGPFRAFVGVVERHLSNKERVIVLLTTVQADMHVEVSTHCLARVDRVAVRRAS